MYKQDINDEEIFKIKQLILKIKNGLGVVDNSTKLLLCNSALELFSEIYMSKILSIWIQGKSNNYFSDELIAIISSSYREYLIFISEDWEKNQEVYINLDKKNILYFHDVMEIVQDLSSGFAPFEIDRLILVIDSFLNGFDDNLFVKIYGSWNLVKVPPHYFFNLFLTKCQLLYEAKQFSEAKLSAEKAYEIVMINEDFHWLKFQFSSLLIKLTDLGYSSQSFDRIRLKDNNSLHIENAYIDQQLGEL